MICHMTWCAIKDTSRRRRYRTSIQISRNPLTFAFQNSLLLFNSKHLYQPQTTSYAPADPRSSTKHVCFLADPVRPLDLVVGPRPLGNGSYKVSIYYRAISPPSPSSCGSRSQWTT